MEVPFLFGVAVFMEGKKLKNLLSNKLMAVSGWGTGAGMLFAVLHRRSELTTFNFEMLDGFLSVCVAVFLC
ncbi:hypothetical protein D3C76_355830 [compost metagenome]